MELISNTMNVGNNLKLNETFANIVEDTLS